MPATKKKFPMKTLLALRLRQPIKDNDRVVNVVANAPIAKAVCTQSVKAADAEEMRHTGFPICDLMVIGTGTEMISWPLFVGITRI